MDSQAIPLVVGVTGHRALRPDDEALLREKLGEIFGELGTRYGGTPLLLLTSLAEGADRLVAEVGRELEIPFLVPLPMERKEYEKDFVAAGSLEKFNALMAAAEGSFELSFMPGLTGEDVGDPANRAEQYAAAGKYILRHSHVLLALWDGDQAEKTGGTSQMVRYRLTGYPPLSGPELGWLYPPEVGPVYHLVTPREGKPEPADKFAVRRYYTGQLYAEKEEGEEKALAGKEKEKEKEAKEQEKREGQAEKIFDLMLRRTASFNRDVENHPPSEAARRRSAAGLRPPGVPEEDEAREALVARFVAADALARRFRNWRWLLFGALMVFMIPASFFLSGYDRPGEKSDAQDISRWLFTGSVLAAVAVLCFVRWWRIEAKFLDYRALAEGWKILYFWRMAGLEEDVSEQYLRLQR
jgi:hypothetical protein